MEIRKRRSHFEGLGRALGEDGREEGSAHDVVGEEDRSRSFAVEESRSYWVVGTRHRSYSLKRGRYWEGGLGIEGVIAEGWGVAACSDKCFEVEGSGIDSETRGSGTNLAAENCRLVGLIEAWFGRQSEHCRVALY